jgi:hypothetical protein
MDIAIPGMLLVALVVCGVVLLFAVGAGLITLLIKAGVIVREARRPPHMDAGDYRLDQGRDVRSEDEQR